MTCWHCLASADFVSAPNLTAAAAAQNLTWAPVSVEDVAVDSYAVDMVSGSALLTLSLTAELGVSGSIDDVIDASSSRRRRLQQTTAGQSGSKVLPGLPAI